MKKRKKGKKKKKKKKKKRKKEKKKKKKKNKSNRVRTTNAFSGKLPAYLSLNRLFNGILSYS